MSEDETSTRMAVAMLRCIEAELHLPYMEPETVDQPLFDGPGLRLGGRAIDSLDVIEAMVALDEELGVLILDRPQLEAAGTIRGLARLLIARADRGAVERFCERWAMVGLYRA